MYNLRELKKEYPKGVDFPEDVNSLAVDAFLKLSRQTCFDDFVSNRWYGTLCVNDNNEEMIGYFEFQFGVAIQWKLVKKRGNCVYHVNIRNQNVTTKTPKGITNGR